MVNKRSRQIRAQQEAWAAKLAEKPQFIAVSSLSQGAVTPADAARRLHDETIAILGDDCSTGVPNEAFDVGPCLLEAAMRTPPEDQGPLVETINLLRDLPPVLVPKSGEVLTLNGNKTWSDLPGFPITITDQLVTMGADISDRTPAELTRYECATAFAARLTASARAHPEWPTTDFSIHAVTAFSRAFDSSAVTSFALRCVSLWIRYAGPVLWAHCREGHRLPVTPASDPPEFSLEEWSAWKGKLAGEANRTGTARTAEDLQMVQEALHSMELAQTV